MWTPRAIIVMVLAIAVSAGYVIGIAGLVIWGRSLSDIGGEVLITLIGALIAIISAYVGKERNYETPPSTPSVPPAVPPGNGEGGLPPVPPRGDTGGEGVGEHPERSD